MSFGESMFLAGFNQKNHQGGPIHQSKSRLSATKPMWEDSRTLQKANHKDPHPGADMSG
jgi:hypothetical protein